MKLNNRGWSLNTMVTLIVVLLLVVILVSVLAYNFGKNNEFGFILPLEVHCEK